MGHNTQRWAATMPREKPPEGKTNVVCAIRSSRGYRAEIQGAFPEETMVVIWKAMNRLAAGLPLDADAIANEIKAAQAPKNATA